MHIRYKIKPKFVKINVLKPDRKGKPGIKKQVSYSGETIIRSDYSPLSLRQYFRVYHLLTRMADKPSRALVLYGDGSARSVDPSNTHIHSLASVGTCGFLSLPHAPPGFSLSLPYLWFCEALTIHWIKRLKLSDKSFESALDLSYFHLNFIFSSIEVHIESNLFSFAVLLLDIYSAVLFRYSRNWGRKNSSRVCSFAWCIRSLYFSREIDSSLSQ